MATKSATKTKKKWRSRAVTRTVDAGNSSSGLEFGPTKLFAMSTWPTNGTVSNTSTPSVTKKRKPHTETQLIDVVTRFRSQDLTQEEFGPVFGRICKEVFGSSHLHYFSTLHEHDPVSDLASKSHFVSNDHHRDARPC